MSETETPTDGEIAQALERNGVHPGYLRVIRDYLARSNDAWRFSCCDSGCDPCVQTLARVVDEVQRARSS